eukprot:CAMPEP_0206228476 /NCGR_PEP_ID=MMETSP0047_2-20121206/9189_1 /ASSEMBLY_ACC=CAM_ASM_000192 /TAXON_ID=195065 /ORGANISM="Chroomonas mesostigmatica_cf, Strain CCMP1168" /LENGTH=389 /DNA_ID=CAMNT_0053651721 /DNA_START=166 /DNA_END=1335 /DNA_ORIENTATION=+
MAHAPFDEATSCTSTPRIPFEVGEIYEILPGKLSFAVFTGDDMTREYIQRHKKLFFFSANHQESYEPFCADFGPVNLGVVHDFCAYVRGFWEHPKLQHRQLVFYCENAVEMQTNAAFLLAAYLVLEHRATPEEAWGPLGRLSGAFATFRDATFCKQDYHLTIQACLQGLHSAVAAGYYAPDAFRPHEYAYLDDPAVADMHVISPKFIAFRGPADADAPGALTAFDPRHYASVFRGKGVTAVVRLNEATGYDPAGFTKEGFRHYDLYFDDCTAPPPAVVDRFLAICEAEEGAVAVHCAAGLGRTGTLIAACLIRRHGWGAAEAIGWLRVVRPGSVIGPQQRWLHAFEEGCSAEPSPSSAGGSEAMGLQVAAAQGARAKRLRCKEEGDITG